MKKLIAALIAASSLAGCTSAPQPATVAGATPAPAKPASPSVSSVLTAVSLFITKATADLTAAQAGGVLSMAQLDKLTADGGKVNVTLADAQQVHAAIVAGTASGATMAAKISALNGAVGALINDLTSFHVLSQANGFEAQLVLALLTSVIGGGA